VSLDDVVWTMLNGALGLYRDSPQASYWLRAHLTRFEEPLRIAVAGLPQSGKSTLINAIVGEEIAPIEVDGNQVFTWYQDGPTPRASVHFPQGRPYEVPITRLEKGVHIDLRQCPPQEVNRIVVEWPTRTLRSAILIDTPPIASPSADDASGSAPGSTAEQISAEADAVLYLMHHMHDKDMRFLQAVHDHPIARAAPVNMIVVLSRADEIGGGRIDSLSSANQIARRYRRDVRTRALCQNVVALAGLVAQAGRTLRDTEFAALSALASVPRATLEDVLLSVDRFAGSEFPIPLEPEVRAELLERFGIFGVRLATTLIRTGSDTKVKLSAQLVQRSGLSELRESIGQYFTDRSQVLKARSALLALDVVLRREPRPSARKLVLDVERLLASAHDFRELRLLAALQVGRTMLPTDLGLEAQRLVGGYGTSPWARLGIDEQAAETELEEAIFDALYRWQEQAENPMLSQEQRRAARTVVRSCEGMLAQHPSRPGVLG
jgi:hypothetical protein